MAKKGRPSNKEKEIQEKANERVKEVFGDILKFDKKNSVEVANKIDEVVKTNGNKWLQDQLEEMGKENEELKVKLAKSQEDYAKILAEKSAQVSSAPVQASESDTQLKNGIRKLFYDLDNNYRGKNANRTPYRSAEIKPLLDKILRSFPFLIEERKQNVVRQ